jgi:hypothetical protein
MNKPKFKVGDKVMWDGKENNGFAINMDVVYTISQIIELGGRTCYTLNNCADIFEDNLNLCQPKEKRLEYGYCEIGDIIVDEDGNEFMILDVRERIVFLSELDDANTYGFAETYIELEKNRYKIKQDKPEDDIVAVTLETLKQLYSDEHHVPVDKLRIKE